MLGSTVYVDLLVERAKRPLRLARRGLVDSRLHARNISYCMPDSKLLAKKLHIHKNIHEHVGGKCLVVLVRVAGCGVVASCVVRLLRRGYLRC